MSTEKETQKAILEFLAVKGIFHYRNNSGALPIGQGGNTRFIRFGAVGSPDIICVVKGLYVGIEVKGEKGKLSPNQISFREALVRAGGIYIEARSVDVIIKHHLFA